MNKQQFVSFELSRVMRAANEDIRVCTYESINGAEIVTIHMKSGAKYYADVTADSYMAIIADVVKVMSHH